MTVISPSPRPSANRNHRPALRRPFVLLAILCATGLLWSWFSTGTAHSQPSPQDSPLETATSTPDPALFPTETPTLVPTETPDPALFPTETPPPLPTETPLPAPENGLPGDPAESADAPTPVDRPQARVESPTLDAFGVIGRVVASMASVAAWIWLLCGSLIFFVVAGIVGGLLFSQRERHRYDLYVVEAEDEPRYDVIEPPSSDPRDDDSWPASLR